jgi:2-phosphosulfolactate phosphatase
MAKPTVEVCLSPLLLQLSDIQESVVVVIDVFRATSTMCAAIFHGVERIIPVENIEACEQYRGKGFLLAGERGGEKVAGFDLGNSPLDYLSGVNNGKTLVLTTTNGTRAIELARSAAEVVAGAFVNLTAISEHLRHTRRNVILVCAGWKDKVNMEDTLLAGAIVNRLRRNFDSEGDAALGARQLFRNYRANLNRIMRHASHFQRLRGLGINEDIDYCLTQDLAPVVPVLRDGALVRSR